MKKLVSIIIINSSYFCYSFHLLSCFGGLAFLDFPPSEV